MATYAGMLRFAYTGGLSGPSCTVGQQHSTIPLAPVASMVLVAVVPAVVYNMALPALLAAPVVVCEFVLVSPACVSVPTAGAADVLAPGIGALSAAASFVSAPVVYLR